MRLILTISLSFLHLKTICNPTGPSSEPFISGDTWRHHVNHILSDVEIFDPLNVKPGDLIFVEQDSLFEFYTHFQTKIQSHYILITAHCDRGGDMSLPGKFDILLNDQHLYGWFTQNLDRSDARLHPIPIGLANQKWPWGNVKLYQTNKVIKSKLLYINFCIQTNPKIRQSCWDYFSSLSYADCCKRKSQDYYLKEISDYYFVISPPGNGLDCHRTWEVLLLGSYPIVLSSTLNPLYENLPVVIVNDWNEVNFDFLQRKLEEFENQSWNFDKLYFGYWFDKVKNLQEELLSGVRP